MPLFIWAAIAIAMLLVGGTVSLLTPEPPVYVVAAVKATADTTAAVKTNAVNATGAAVNSIVEAAPVATVPVVKGREWLLRSLGIGIAASLVLATAACALRRSGAGGGLPGAVIASILFASVFCGGCGDAKPNSQAKAAPVIKSEVSTVVKAEYNAEAIRKAAVQEGYRLGVEAARSETAQKVEAAKREMAERAEAARIATIQTAETARKEAIRKAEAVRKEVKRKVEEKVFPLALAALVVTLLGPGLTEGTRKWAADTFKIGPNAQLALAWAVYGGGMAAAVSWLMSSESPMAVAPCLMLLAGTLWPFRFEVVPGIVTGNPVKSKSGSGKIKALVFAALVVVIAARLLDGKLPVI